MKKLRFAFLASILIASTLAVNSIKVQGTALIDNTPNEKQWERTNGDYNLKGYINLEILDEENKGNHPTVDIIISALDNYSTLKTRLITFLNSQPFTEIKDKGKTFASVKTTGNFPKEFSELKDAYKLVSNNIKTLLESNQWEDWKGEVAPHLHSVLTALKQANGQNLNGMDDINDLCDKVSQMANPIGRLPKGNFINELRDMMKMITVLSNKQNDETTPLWSSIKPEDFIFGVGKTIEIEKIKAVTAFITQKQKTEVKAKPELLADGITKEKITNMKLAAEKINTTAKQQLNDLFQKKLANATTEQKAALGINKENLAALKPDQLNEFLQTNEMTQMAAADIINRAPKFTEMAAQNSTYQAIMIELNKQNVNKLMAPIDQLLNGIVIAADSSDAYQEQADNLTAITEELEAINKAITDNEAASDILTKVIAAGATTIQETGTKHIEKKKIFEQTARV